MKEVQVLTEQYQQAYNRIRLHRSLGSTPPAHQAVTIAEPVPQPGPNIKAGTKTGGRSQPLCGVPTDQFGECHYDLGLARLVCYGVTLATRNAILLHSEKAPPVCCPRNSTWSGHGVGPAGEETTFRSGTPLRPSAATTNRRDLPTVPDLQRPSL